VARNFERVHFEFDSAALDNSSRQALSENAAILARYPDIKIEIQGHCDERGSTGYNLALGQKRADAVYRHLSSAGVTSNRLSTISYGEERPLAKGFAEHAWAQNRRAEFRITWGDAPVLGSAR
jgi:peptidoglycan-associated lipoprotein